MRRLGTQARVWSLGQRLQQGLRNWPLRIRSSSSPWRPAPAPSLAFGLEADSAAAKVLYLHRLVRGFLVSGYYVLGTHDEAQIESLLAALEEVFTGLEVLRPAAGSRPRREKSKPTRVSAAWHNPTVCSHRAPTRPQAAVSKELSVEKGFS